jgi:hypothetical protein
MLSCICSHMNFERVKMRGGFRWAHKLPKGRVLVHKHIMLIVVTPNGFNGFRCWTQNIDKKLVRCGCGWRGVAWRETLSL